MEIHHLISTPPGLYNKPWLINCGGSSKQQELATEMVPPQVNSLGFINVGLTLGQLSNQIGPLTLSKSHSYKSQEKVITSSTFVLVPLCQTNITMESLRFP